MPDGKNIKDWRIGADGITYSIIYSTPSEKSIKKYWIPQVYVGKIKEADKLVYLLNQLEATLNMRDSYRKFFDTLPNGCYNVSSIIIWCKEKSKKK